MRIRDFGYACLFSLLVSPGYSRASDVAPLGGLSLAELMQIEVVTASRKKKKVSDSAANIHVITRVYVGKGYGTKRAVF